MADNTYSTPSESEMTEQYRQRTPQSRELYQRAQESLPGGDTRSVTFHRPYPTFIERAKGTTLTTVDGEQLVDFLNNYTQAIHGHAPEEVVEAINDRMRRGNGLGAPTEEVIELAERIIERFPAIETFRFGNSGTEGTMNAVRSAMAFTGNEKIVKIQGGYHGTHDAVEVGVSGEGRENAGIPRDITERVHTVRFNDPEALKSVFESQGDHLACLILEPIMGAGGMIPATQEYLETARDVTEATDTLLIFDEVMTSRLSTGGMQKRTGVHPDLTAMGKYIGGGLPIGGFGGRADVMEVFHPENGTVSHSGTFNGNPATMVGGIETLKRLDEDAIERINGYGDEIRERVSALGDQFEIPLQVTGLGSLFHLHFTDQEVTDAESAGTNAEGGVSNDFNHEFFLAMRNQGVFMASRGMGNTSTPMTQDDVDMFVSAVEQSLERLSE